MFPLSQSRLFLVAPAAAPKFLNQKSDGVRSVLTEFAPPVHTLGDDGFDTFGVWDGTNPVLVGEFGQTGFVPHATLKLETTPPRSPAMSGVNSSPGSLPGGKARSSWFRRMRPLK